MRIYVTSDTHGRIDEFVQYIKTIEKPDLIIHLGDYVEDALEIERTMKIDTVKIKGNCDFMSREAKEEDLLVVNRKRIFLTHGHKYDVKFSILNLFYKAKEEKADLVLFGHTHAPMIEKEGDIVFMNPGSPVLPRGFNNKSFGVIEIKEKIQTKIVEI